VRAGAKGLTGCRGCGSCFPSRRPPGSFGVIGSPLPPSLHPHRPWRRGQVRARPGGRSPPQAPRFRDGAWLVPLAPVSSPELLGPAIAEALGLQAASGADTRAQLFEHLRERHLLRVLDGMEHLLGVAPLLVALAKRAPGLELLVTSQERLGCRANGS